MKKEQVDLENAVVWIPDSKTANGIAEVPLTEIAVKAFRDQMALAGKSTWLFPSDENPSGAPEDSEDGVACRFEESEGVVLPDLRPPFDVRDPPERGWGGG